MARSTIFCLALVLFVLASACGGSGPAKIDDSRSPTPRLTTATTPALTPDRTPNPATPTSASSTLTLFEPTPTTEATPHQDDNMITEERSIEGRWVGANEILGQKLNVVVHFEFADVGLTGTIDIPKQGATGLELSGIRLEGSQVHFELVTDISVAKWDGELVGQTISGAFNQARFSGTFLLSKGGGEEFAKSEADDTDKSLPYVSEDLTFRSNEIRLAATLTHPAAPGPHPAIILITGSGSQDLNEEIFGFKIFQKIADYLSRNGVAVLRWDDRGVGGSSGDLKLATLRDLADDIGAAVELLKVREEIDADRIGLLGHSEGGLIASIVGAESEDVQFVILMAGPAVPPRELLLIQGEQIMRAAGATQEQIALQTRVREILFEAVSTDEGWEEATQAIRQGALAAFADLPESAREQLGDIDEYLISLTEAQLVAARTPAFKFLLSYDPRPDLEQMTIPVLALFGELDLQVPADSNVGPLTRALETAGNRDFTIEVFPGANHLFQIAELGTVEEYAMLEKDFIPGFLETITNWLYSRTGVRPLPAND